MSVFLSCGLLSCCFLHGVVECHAPCATAAQHGVDAEKFAHAALWESGGEVASAEDGHCFRCHLETLALACESFVLHLSQQDAGTQVERIHQQVEMRIEACQMLCMVVG